MINRLTIQLDKQYQTVSRNIFILLCLSIFFVGCSTSPQIESTVSSEAHEQQVVVDNGNQNKIDYSPESEEELFDFEVTEIDDPFEEFNRAVFKINDITDHYLIGPIARAYGNVTPEPVKRSLKRALQNLGAPVRFANDILQGEASNASTTLGRFFINSTVGLAGLFDLADDIGLEYHESDFGETLHQYGVDSGPYLVLPLFGPSTVRDSVGFAVDFVMNPFTHVLPTDANLAIGLSESIIMREAYNNKIETLRDTSIDPYATFRSIYVQQREAQLNQ